MDIKAEKFVVTLTHNELWTILFHIHRSILHAVESHWVRHPEAFQKNAKEDLYMHKYIASMLWRADLHDDLMEECNAIINKVEGSKSVGNG